VGTSSAAGSDGKWSVDFAIDTRWNATIVINGSSGVSAVLHDVAFGEVLLCSGQSNMELAVAGPPLTPAMETGIRVMRPDHWSSPNITQDTVAWHHSWDGTGTACTDRCGGPWGSLGDNPQFSAVCKFTATSLFQSWNGTVPIGLVESAWGGTRIESWSSPDALAQCPDDTTAGCGPPIGGSSQMGRMNSTNSGNLCSAAYNGMLHPLLPMRFKAMLWYQGESNLDPFEGEWAGARNYACRARAAVVDWRVKFEQPDMPFFFVELAACNDYDDATVTFPLLRQVCFLI
jgi:sialate O-acetylesterase